MSDGTASGRATLVHLVSGYASTWLVVACARLGIADVLAAGTRDALAIAEAVGGDVSSVTRLMDTLAALGVVDRSTLGAASGYRLNDVSHWLRRDVAGGYRDLALLAGAAPIQAAWAAVDRAVRSGHSAFASVHHESFFDHLDRDAELLATFQRAGAGDPDWNMSIAEACDFGDARHVIDIGGGDGTFLRSVLSAHPHLHGTLLERASVLGLDSMRSARPFDTLAGDFLDPLPEAVAAADRLMLRRVLHDWDDERAARILSHCRAAMSSTGRLLVIEYVVTPGHAHMTALLDFTMLVLTGGRERSLAELERLLAQSGLALDEVIATPVGISVLVAKTAT